MEILGQDLRRRLRIPFDIKIHPPFFIEPNETGEDFCMHGLLALLTRTGHIRWRRPKVEVIRDDDFLLEGVDPSEDLIPEGNRA